jgi:hypothetical protein
VANKTLHAAKTQKKDEFYTQLSDIENELKHYKDLFRSKIVFCNCDDPYESNFFKYFANNFNHLGLKKLITTSFTKSPIAGTQLSLLDVEGLKPGGKQPFKVEINEVPDSDGSGSIDLSDVQYLLKHDKNTATPLKENGDFRSNECVELLKQADIVVTNPPFSLFREYIAQLVEHDKKFLIIGAKNAIKYNFVFKLIRQGNIWLGYGFSGGNAFFKTPYGGEGWANGVYNPETGLVKFRNISWFTNMDFEERHEDLQLYKKYKPEEFPKYDNYEAIEVSKTADIPMDYDGVMGVPITFLDKYNPDQFEILAIFDDKREKSEAFIQGTPTYVDEQHRRYVGPVLKGKALYTRILIKRKAAK